MEALCVQHLEEDREKEKARMEDVGTAAEEDEETAVPAVRRKVSFADAFGLDLVSVKEFVDVTEVSEEREASPSEEFYLSCLFHAPSSLEELERSLEAQMVDLESIELLPGTTTLRGTVRVLNLCYSKSVYARITLDRWRSYFDLMADYLPGSSDRKTDRFTFQYTVVPPLEKEGTRVEFCLRYETSVGTFWANNKEMNYVMFCHQKSPVKQEVQRSCLKANRRGSAQVKQNNSTAVLPTEAEARREEESAESPSLFHHVGNKPLVEGIKSRQRSARPAHVKDVFSHRWGQHNAGNSDGIGTRKQSNKMPHVLTYHQIPLITLDWDSENNLMDDIWRERAEVTVSKEQNVKAAASVNDIWGSFVDGKGHAADNDTSVCEVWQTFINGPCCEDDTGVAESEWLRTAALVSPAPEEKEHARNATPDASAASQALSHASQTSPDHVSLRGDNGVAAEWQTALMSAGSVDTPEERRNKGDERLREWTPIRHDSGERPTGVWEDTGGTTGHQRTEMEVEALLGLLLEEDEKKNEDIGPPDDQVIISNGTSLQVLQVNPEACALRHFPTEKTRSREGQKSLKLTKLCSQPDALDERVGVEIPKVSLTLEDTLGINEIEDRQEHNLTENTNALEAMESRLDGGVVGADGTPDRPTDPALGVHVETGSTSTEDDAHAHPAVRHPSQKSNGFVWWSVLYILSHIARFVTRSLPVAGMVVMVSLYDVLASSVLYMFSCFQLLTCLLAWWFYKWKGPQGVMNGVVG